MQCLRCQDYLPTDMWTAFEVLLKYASMLFGCSIGPQFTAVIGEIFGHNRRDPSVCKSNRLHVDILRIPFMKLGCILCIPLKWSVSFPTVLNFNWLFLRLDLRFSCSELRNLLTHLLSVEIDVPQKCL